MKGLQTRKDLLKEVKRNARKRHWNMFKEVFPDYILLSALAITIAYLINICLF